MARKKKYLNNADMLKQIHLSKNTYCKYLDPLTDSDYDFIVEDKDEIFGTQNVQVGKDENGKPIMEDVPVIDLARQARATRLTKAGIPTNVEDVKNTDIVFRVMTSEHIPLVPKKKAKKKKAKKKAIVSELFEEFDEDEDILDPVIPVEPTEEIEMIPMRCKFPPFFHYRLTENNELKLVGKSHWKGDFETGEFCMTHGQVTNELAKMYMKLCDRYATRSNWRGYCVDNSTEALTQRGWLSQEEITKDDIILSYHDGNMKWSKIKSIFRDEYNGLMHKLDVKGMDALITPEHKLVTDRGLVKVEYLLEKDKVILIGDAEETSTKEVYSNNFVELIGWIVTEGVYQLPKQSIQIYQNAGKYADRIRDCLNNLGYEFSESLRGKNICFSLRRPASKEIFKILPEKNLNMNFILSLTKQQRELLIDTMIDGDGWRNGRLRRYCQKDKHHVDLFQALCALNGHKTNSHISNIVSYGKETTIYTVNLFSRKHTRGSCIDMHGGKRSGKIKGRGKINHPNEPTTYYKGMVWCPETEYGSFLARRNGKVYLTGNTYNEEMRGQALLQLAQIGLQFNELRSQNPFAYYTAAVTNSFTRILNIEKKMQNIRDDILEANGLTPSWTRQFKNDNGDQKYLDNPND